ncbi:hypothetical protein [Nocardia macrotermitis]|uniref:Uncharacterized protein n=1 Tax=Nocardia macrotermitis TaxID=2585198 RepID=A0A7K0DCW1_9NOCA|nr:hypothetical protein [Nocardia macrotermitis]MQY23610.1 hypothetical protein [Nocardia macrotermitis]
MYRYEIVADASEQVDGLPVDVLVHYAELIAFLELTPWEGPAYRDDKPDGAMRRMVFGPGGGGLVVYVILEQDRRVVVVSVSWVG